MSFKVERIRRLTSSDLSVANQVKQSATRRFGDEYQTCEISFEELTAKVRQDWARGLWIDDDLAAICYGRSEDEDLHIDFVGVKQEFEGRRYGVRLINDLVASAVAREMERVTLVTSASAPWNMPYYEGLGFELVRQSKASKYLRTEIDTQSDTMKSYGLLLPRVAMALELA